MHYFISLCHRCDKSRACSLMWRFQCIYLCCAYLWILRKCLFKTLVLHLIMPFKIGNLHHSFSWHIVLPLVDCGAMSHGCSVGVGVIMVSECAATKTKVKVKKCACSSEWPSCLCIVGMETHSTVQVLTQPKHISEGITVGGYKHLPPTEDLCYSIWSTVILPHIFKWNCSICLFPTHPGF